METELDFNKELDPTQKQKVTYCVPEWQRDEQVKLAIKRIKGRIEPSEEKRNDPVAVVCFGPSLNNTWEEIRKFKYVISCSGSHKFLVERGIIPTWHVEVDPRPHKVELIGKPQKDTEYLIASCCHPKVFDLLEGYNVKLWHVFSGKPDAMRDLPDEEWALTGGSSVGLRALTIARFLGFLDVHIFGMDGNEGLSGKHAAYHPNAPVGSFITTVNDIKFRTTPSLLECARQTFHELNQMPDVKPTFHGFGIVQELAKNWILNPVKEPMIAIWKPKLISDEYAELNKRLHEERAEYGVGGASYAPTVLSLYNEIEATSILDYGCGKGYLAKNIPFPIWEYDPAIPGKTQQPRPADLVVCTDVLEHVEPDKLPIVLIDLRRCVLKLGFFVIAPDPSMKFLADGRNAHLIQQDIGWWQEVLKDHFNIKDIKQEQDQRGNRRFLVLVRPLIKEKKETEKS